MAVITSLISYWPFDEASGNALDAHGSNPLTDNNTVSSGSGVSAGTSGSRDFVRLNDEYFSHADNADLSAGDTDFSFQVWVNMTAKADGRVFFCKWDGAGTEYIVMYDAGAFATDRFIFALNGPGGFVTLPANTLGSPSASTWYLIHAWHDSVNNLMGISVNAGTADTTAYTGGPSDTTAVFYMGQLDGQTWNMSGRMDEAAIWRKVLSSTERTWLYNSGSGRSYADIVAEAGGGGATIPVFMNQYRQRWG